MQIWCISGDGVTPVIDRALLSSAHKLYISGAGRAPFRTDDGEGVVETDYSRAAMGAIAGIVFVAEIETNGGTRTVKYIVRSRNLEAFEEPFDLLYSPGPERAARN